MLFLSSPEGQRITASANQPLGFALAIEYRPIARVGVEFSGMYARPTVDAASVFQGDRIEGTWSIEGAMAGNICRCGTYVRIKEAVKKAAANS